MEDLRAHLYFYKELLFVIIFANHCPKGGGASPVCPPIEDEAEEDVDSEDEGRKEDPLVPPDEINGGLWLL